MIRLTEEMFASGLPIAQGEVLLWMKKYAPKSILKRLSEMKNVTLMNVTYDKLILGHSETGHHHVLEAVRQETPISQAAQALIDATNDMLVDLKLQEECKLTHMRGHDTHDGFILPAGEYVRLIREENSVEGWVRVSD